MRLLEPGPETVIPRFRFEFHPFAEHLENAVLLQKLRCASRERFHESVHLHAVIAVEQAGDGRQKERRVANNGIKPAPGDRFETIALQKRDVVDAVQSRIDPAKIQGPWIDVGADHGFSTGCRSQCERATPVPRSKALPPGRSMLHLASNRVV